MVGTSAWVGVHPLVDEVQVLQLVSVEIARNVDDLTVHNYHLPSQLYFLGHDGCQVAQEMTSAIDHQDLPLHQ